MNFDTRSYTKSLIGQLYPNRANDDIVGQHDDLQKYISWYGGKTKWHKQRVMIKGEERIKTIAHSGLGKLACDEWAAMFLNEGLAIAVPEEKGNDILQSIFKENHLLNRLNRFGNKYFGLGFGASLVMPSKIKYLEDTKTINTNEDVKVKINFLDATRSYPITIDEDDVIECAILKLQTNHLTLQVHLLDENGFYVISEVKGTNKGDGTYSLDFKSLKTWNTKSSVKLFQAWYPVNVDNNNLDNPIGTSILTDEAIEWIKGFDTAFDKFIVEYKNGGKRRYISADLNYINEDGEIVNVELADEDIYLPPSKMAEAQNMVQEHTSEIRADGFIRGMQFFASMFGRAVGLGEDSFSIDQQGRPVMTATAAILKKNGGFRNVKRNCNLAEANLIDMCMAIKEVYNSCVKANALTYEREDVAVSFDDNIIEDTQTKKDNDLKLVQAGLMTFVEYRQKWFEEAEEDAIEFVHNNALLIDKYITALQAGAMTPEIFVDIVYGEKVKNREQLIAYITEHLSAPVEEDYNMDTEDNENENEEVDEEEEEDE